jgi:hypothetical protein
MGQETLAKRKCPNIGFCTGAALGGSTVEVGAGISGLGTLQWLVSMIRVPAAAVHKYLLFIIFEHVIFLNAVNLVRTNYMASPHDNSAPINVRHDNEPAC